MTSVNLVPFLTSDTFSEQVEDLYDTLGAKVRSAVQAKLAEADIKKDDSSLSYLKDLL
jgi:hypothetical protein